MHLSTITSRMYTCCNPLQPHPLLLLLGQTSDSHNIKILGQKGFATTQLFKAKTLNFESLGIGGLDKQFDAIFRRAFASRVFPPSIVQRLGIQHVKVRCS
jgi:hypothetical protein